MKKEFIDSKGTSDWEGWGTALKPALEPITVARKPLSEKTVAENVLKYGTGGINIDECRVGTEILIEHKMGNIPNDRGEWGLKEGYIMPERIGRFPANLIHDGSEEVTSLFPDTKSQGHWSKTKTTGFGEFGNGKSEYLGVGEKDKLGGSAARFFYCAKASSSERNEGCDELPTKTASELTGRKENSKGLSGSEEYQNSTNPYSNGGSVLPRANNHPTVKPLKLMQYLVRLVTRKGGVVLDPFMGSGTTAVACKFEDMNFLGFEMEKDYCDIAKERVENYLSEYEIKSYDDSKKVVLKQQRWF